MHVPLGSFQLGQFALNTAVYTRRLDTRTHVTHTHLTHMFILLALQTQLHSMCIKTNVKLHLYNVLL